jgi:uncharacterized protein YjlB
MVEGEGFDAVELVAGRAVVVPDGVGAVKVRSGVGASFGRCFAPE